MITSPKAAAMPVEPSEPSRSESSTIAPQPANTSAKVANASAKQRRARDGLVNELADQGVNPCVDLVANPSHRLEVLSCRVVERPVLVSLAGVDRARVAASHRDDDVRF